MNKAVAWIVLLLGIYEILAILVDSIPGVLVENVWGWVIGVALILIGLYLFKK